MPGDPKRPLRNGWTEVDVPPFLTGCVAYRRKGLKVFSSRDMMQAPDGSGDLVDTWIVSVSRDNCAMPKDRDLARVRRDFGMKLAEEDNHEDGTARKLFLVVDRARRVACECKTDETVIERPDGYRYSVPKETP